MVAPLKRGFFKIYYYNFVQKKRKMKKNLCFLYFVLISMFSSLFAQDTTYLIPGIEVFADRAFSSQTIMGLRPQNFPSLQSDIGTMLRSMPNTSGIRRGGSAIDPVYRGFRNNQLLITTSNGIRIEGGCPNRMDPTTSHIDAEEIQLIHWETGSNMLLYGQAIGGVLVLKTIEPQPQQKFGIHVKVKSGYESNYNGFSNSVFLSGGNKKVFFSLMGGNKSYGNYTDGRDSVVKSSFQKDFVTTKIGTAIKPNKHLIFSYTRSETRGVRFPALPMDETYDYTDIFNLSYIGYNIDKSENIMVNAYQVRVAHDMDNFLRPQATQVVPPSTSIMRAETMVDAITTGMNAKKTFHFSKLYGIVGLNFHQIDKDGTRTRKMIMTMSGLTTTTTKLDNLWKDAVIRNLGIYGQMSYPIKKLRSEITGTFRYDQHQHFSADTFNLIKDDVTYFTKGTRNNSLYSFGFRYDYRPNTHISFSLDLTSAQRSPNMNELYIKRMVVGFDNYDYLGNPDLKPETNRQISINSRIHGGFGVLGINLFMSQVSDYIGSVLLPPAVVVVATQGALGVKQFSNLGTAHFYGGELVLNSSSKNRIEFGATAGYTYAVLENAIKYNIESNQVVSDTILKNDPLPEIPAMSTSAWILYKIPSLNLIPRLNLEYTLPQKSVSVANYEESTPDYFIINASIRYSYKKWAVVNIGVNNLFNQAYYNHLNRRVISSNPAEKIKLYEPGRSLYANITLLF